MPAGRNLKDSESPGQFPALISSSSLPVTRMMPGRPAMIIIAWPLMTVTDGLRQPESESYRPGGGQITLVTVTVTVTGSRNVPWPAG